MEYNTQHFVRKLKAMGITLTDEQVQQFITYYEMLVEKNKVMNLTGITEFDEVLEKHFEDSLSLIRVVDLNHNLKIMDLGTGAGFPGIPLKIAFPNLKITLADSLNKRILFLQEVIDELQLKDIAAIHGRAEDLARDAAYREQYDLCVSRAVANLSTLAEYCLPFVKKKGYFISYKSEKITEEYEQAKKAIKILGGNYKNQVEFYLPQSDIYRNLFIIEKIDVTPKKYPRKAGMPSKEPII